MAYNSNIPQPNDRFKDTQPQILANFQALAPFGNNAAVIPTSASDPATAANEVAFYAKTSANTAISAFFIRQPSNGSVYEITSSNYAQGTGLIPGWTMLPAGILMKWGRVTTSAGGSATVTLNGVASQPNFSVYYIAQLTPSSNTAISTIARITSLTGSTLTFVGQASTQYHYLVMGTPA